jgi:hypothetical protein
MYVAKKNKIPWISDFRDPWTQYYFLQNLPNTQITLSIHKYLEKLVLNNSDLVITVSNFLKEDFLHRGAKKAEAILNGFDDEDFNIHPEMKKLRCVNLILYLNKGWRDEWGGQLELWDKNMTHTFNKISPIFNRAVIFSV